MTTWKMNFPRNCKDVLFVFVPLSLFYAAAMVADSKGFHKIEFIVKHAIKSFQLNYTLLGNLTHFET